MKKILFIAILGALLLFSSCAQPAEAPSPQEEGVIRIEVSRHGFNNTAQDFHIEVEEDQEVEITFVYGDSDFSQNNPHQIIIPDYDIETGVIDENNPEVTVRFTAGGHGDVIFMCSNAGCVGHSNLVGGRIVINESEH